jgi:hypothetical protein
MVVRRKDFECKLLICVAAAGDDRKAVLQYGKCKKSTFVMDVRRPMSLVQVTDCKGLPDTQCAYRRLESR